MAVGLLAGAALAAGEAPRGVPGGREDPFESGSLLLRAFGDSDGLPQNTVHTITLDGRGFLWAGTQDGAAYYDGRGWTVVNLPERTRSNFLRAIAPGRRGDLWFGTQGAGLARLSDGAWRPVAGLPPELAHQRVNAILETGPPARPVLWVGTHAHGLWRTEAGSWRRLGEEGGLPSERVWAVYETTDDAGDTRLWVGTEAGLVYLAADGERFVAEAGAPRVSVNSLVETEAPDGSRRLFAGTYGAGVAVREGGTWRSISTAAGLPSSFVTSLAEAEPGAVIPAVWVGTDGGGLARLVGDRVTTPNLDPPLPSNAVYSLARTGAGEGTEALWVGTRNGGLIRLREGQWRSFRPLAEAPWMPVNAMIETAGRGAPAIWFGMDGGGLARLHRGEWSFIAPTPGGLPNGSIQCLLATEDADGAPVIWAGTRNGGLARLAAGRWTTYDTATSDLPNDLVQALAETQDADGASTVWVGTRAGLARVTRGRVEHVRVGAGGEDPSVVALAVEPGPPGEAAVWIGTAGGLVRYRAGAWHAYGDELGLLNDTVQALHAGTTASGRRVLWIGTDGGGAACLDIETDTLLFSLTDRSDPPLPNNVVYAILEDRAGRLYLPTNKGVARLMLRPGEPLERGSFEVFTFTWEDGLPRNQCNRSAGMLDAMGRIWIGTVGGAAVLDPARDWVDRTPKRLALDGKVGGGRGRPLRVGGSLQHGERHVTFEYVLLSFFREGETEYRTQLVGLEREPSPWGKDVRREYRALPPGAYSFRVWGRDFAGNVSGPQELTFQVLPAAWQTWWAYLAFVFVLAGLITLMVRARLRAYERRELELQHLVDARTRELTEANQLLIDLSYLDPVTGIANRRRFDERLELEWKRALRGRSPLSLVMIDIDLFKDYNDSYGHQRGDLCLKAVASALSDSLPRSGDSVARYGGEEFAVILPLTTSEGAVRVAEQLRRRVEAFGLPHSGSPISRVVTISCGVATTTPSAQTGPGELVRLADDALYRAKQAGRNRTEAAAHPRTQA